MLHRPVEPAGDIGQVTAVVDASLWMLTTAIALAFVQSCKILQHRRWMTRSYAVAIVFLKVRAIPGLGGWLTSDERITITFRTSILRSARSSRT